MVEHVCVCNLLVSLLCLHCHRAWLIVYVCVMFLFLYCVYTITDHGWLGVCNVLVSLLCLHYHRSWLSMYVCV